jgi:hypothetical protein
MRRLWLLLVLALPASSFADTLTQFGDGPFGTVEANLLIPLGLNSAAFETVAETFSVPGVSGTTDLTFTFQLDFGGFLFTFGFYPVSAVTADPITDKVTHAVQAVSAGTVVFVDSTDNPGAMSGPFSLTPGTELGFFLIPNDTVANFLADPQSYYDPPANTGGIFANKRSPLFSISDANPGEFDQLLSFVGNGITLFTWEDLTRIPGGNTDNSFTDLAFTIDAELNPVVNRPPDCSAAVLSSTGCWPPNHKFTLVEVLGVTDPDGDPVTITVTGITQDEAVKSTGKGSGSTCPDGVLVDTDEDEVADAAGLRCERDGTGNGRVYSVHFTASDGLGGECSGSLTFCVLHDQRPGGACVDSGQTHDSTVCPAEGGGAGLSGPEVHSLDEFNALTPAPLFLRGDVNWDENLDISDGISILNGLFLSDEELGGPEYVDCPDAADANDDGELDISDAIRLISYLYLGGNVPPAPVVAVDADPTLDVLSCP